MELFKIRGRMGVAKQHIVWLIQTVVVAGLIVGGFYYWARRQPDPAKRAVLLRRAGFGLMAQRIAMHYPGITGWFFRKLINFLVTQGEKGLRRT